MNNNIPEHVPTFPIGVVEDLTDLSARQIRYYEDQGLVTPSRNESNHRLYSLNDINQLKKVKELIKKGINTAGIKALLSKDI